MTAMVEPADVRCTAKAKTTGRRCRRYPVPGATVCVIHGGGAPQVQAAAARRLQRERLNGDLGRLLAELEFDVSELHPVEVLLDAVHRCAAMVQVLGALVGGLRTAAAPGVEASDVEDPGRLWGRNHLGDGAPHVLTTMYAEWLDRTARASKLAVDAGVDERRVRMAERLGSVMVGVLRAVLDDLDLTEAQKQVAAVAIPRRLQLVAGGSPGSEESSS